MFHPEQSSRLIDHLRPVFVSLIVIAALVSVVGEFGRSMIVQAQGAEPETAVAKSQDAAPT
jgi:hypothetical protein